MSSTLHLSRPGPRPGRPPKGDREDLFVRLPPALAQRFTDAAATAGTSQSEHMARFLANRYYWRALGGEGGQCRGFGDPKSDRVPFMVRLPRDLRTRFVQEAAARRLSQSDLMTELLDEEYTSMDEDLESLEEGVVSQRSA